MEVEVIAIDGDLVTVRTEYGTIKGYWHSIIPPKFKRYCIEVDCDEAITDSNIHISNVTEFIMGLRNNQIYINAYVEENSDTVLYLRIGPSIMMLEVGDNLNPAVFANKYVFVRLRSLNFWDIHL